MIRRHAPTGLVLAVLLGLALTLPASSEPSVDAQAPSREEFDALAARVTTLEQQVADLRAERLAATPFPPPFPSETPSETPTETPSETPTESPTESPTETPTEPPSETSTPDAAAPPAAADFPTPDSVGPATEPTATYQGSCTVTTDGLVIEDVVVDCEETGLIIDRGVSGVVIRDSVVRGGVSTWFGATDAPSEDDDHPTIFTVESSRIFSGSTPSNNRALGYAHYVVRDSLIQGSHSGLWAHNDVTLVGNHIATDGTSTHQSGLRMLKNSVLRGNTITCTPSGPGTESSGCSGHAVFYREFGVPTNLTIERNFFQRHPEGGPWFAVRFIDCNVNDDCTDIRFTGNLFDLGQGTDGGEFPDDAGDVWSDNHWTDGAPAQRGEVR